MPSKMTSGAGQLKRLTTAQLKQKQMKHATLLAPMAATGAPADPPFLGHPRAVVIVCAAANTSPTNLPRTLAQLGLNGIPFQKAVFKGVVVAGYTIKIDTIPNSPSTTLLQAVTVIQAAPLKQA
jgi:hypothetical protein